jgi:hypothetical protein
VNIYRLLRVRAAELGFEQFIEAEGGEHQVALVLLAIQIGRAELGVKLLHHLAASPRDGTFAAFLEALADPARQQTELPLTDADRRGLAEISTRLQGVERAVGGRPILTRALEPYARWAHEVGRYSFYWRTPRPAEHAGRCGDLDPQRPAA